MGWSVSMDEASQAVQCGACGAFVNEPANLPSNQRKGCPYCGSTTRHFNVNVSDTLHFHESLGMRHKNAAGKTLAESMSGDDLHRKTGKWMHKERVIDHASDRYKEVVTDPESGVVVHRCEEPLSSHVGHGSDRNPQKL